MIGPQHDALLLSLARKYVWWKTPEEACRHPERVIAQVMTVGEFHDVERLAAFEDSVLKDVLIHSDAGVFDERSWVYWHLVLGLSDGSNVPMLPVRKIA